MEVNSGNPVYDAIVEFIGFMAPIVFIVVVYQGLRILFMEKKVKKSLGNVKK